MKDELKRAAISTGLRKLFPERPTRHDSFSIIDFESLCEVVGVTLEKRERSALRLFHCVDFVDMTEDERMALIRSCAEILERPEVKLPQLEMTEAGRVLPALDSIRPGEIAPYNRRLGNA